MAAEGRFLIEAELRWRQGNSASFFQALKREAADIGASASTSTTKQSGVRANKDLIRLEAEGKQALLRLERAGIITAQERLRHERQLTAELQKQRNLINQARGVPIPTPTQGQVRYAEREAAKESTRLDRSAGRGTDAKFRQAAEADRHASEADTAFAAATAAATEARAKIAAQEAVILSLQAEYIAAMATVTAAREQLAAQIAVDPDVVSARAGKRIAQAEANVAQNQEILAHRANVQALAREEVAHKLLEREVRAEARVLGGQRTRPSFFQRLQGAAHGTDPLENSTAGQLFSSKLITTAGYAASGAVLFGGAQAIRSLITEATELQKELAVVESQFERMGGEIDGMSFEDVREGILEVGQAAGTTLDVTASVARQLAGAFGDAKTGAGDYARGLQEAQVGLQFSKISGLPTQEITDSTTAISLAFAEVDKNGEKIPARFEEIYDSMLGLEERFGVLAPEILRFTADMAPLGAELGFTKEQLAGLGAVAQSASGKTGSVLAEQFGRVFASLQENGEAVLGVFSSIGDDRVTRKLAQNLASANIPGVLEVILQNFDRLNDTQKRTFGELIGGARQAGAVYALLNRSQVALDVLAVPVEGEGEFRERFAKYQETIQGALDQLKVQFEQFGNAVLESGAQDAIVTFFRVIGTAAKLGIDVISFFSELNSLAFGMPAKILVLVAAMKALSIAIRAVAVAQAQFAATKFGTSFAASGAGAGPGGWKGGVAAFDIRRFFGGGGAAAAGAGTVGGGLTSTGNLNWAPQTAAGGAATTGSAAGGFFTLAATAIIAGALTWWESEKAKADADAERARERIRKELEDGKTTRGLIQEERRRLQRPSEAHLDDRGRIDVRSLSVGQRIEQSLGIGEDFTAPLKEAYTADNDLLVEQLGILQQHKVDFAVDIDKENNSLLARVERVTSSLPVRIVTGGGPGTNYFQTRTVKDQGIEEAIKALRENPEDIGLQIKVRAEYQRALAEAIAAGDDTLARELQEALERFTHGGLTVLETRSSLSDARTRAAIARMNAGLGDIGPVLEGYREQIRLIDLEIEGLRAKKVDANEINEHLKDLAEKEAKRAELVKQLNDAYNAPILRYQSALDYIADLSGDDGTAQLEHARQAMRTVKGPEAQYEAAKAVIDAQRKQFRQWVDSAATEAEAILRRQTGIDYDKEAVDIIRKSTAKMIVDSAETRSAAKRIGWEYDQFVVALYNYIMGNENAFLEMAASADVSGDLLSDPNYLNNLEANRKKVEQAQNYGESVKPPPVPEHGSGYSAEEQAAENKRAAEEAKRKAEEARQAAIDERNARDELAKAIAGNNAVLLARIDVNAASRHIREAQTAAERLRAQAEKVNADRTLRDAIADVFNAHLELLQAVANAAGDSVRVALLGLQRAKRELARAKKEGSGKAELDRLRAEVVNAEAAVRDERLGKKLDDIDFALEFGRITTQQAIAQLQALLNAKDTLHLNQDQVRDLMRRIKALKDDLSQNFALNLSEIQLPTDYEINRLIKSNAPGGPGTYNDNRTIQINNNNAQDYQGAISQIESLMTAAPTTGAEPGAY